MEHKHLRAGEFGTACRLSPKALRLYAEQGLLVPAKVDPATGYRWYTTEQLPRARLIARLRALGLPLARIGHLADLTPQARALELRGWLRAQRNLLDERAAAIEAGKDADSDAALAGLVSLRDVPATKVVSRSRHVTTAELPDLIRTAEHDIRSHLRASGVGAGGPMLVRFQELVTPDSEGLVEVAVAYDGTVEPAGDLSIRLNAAHTEVYLPVPPSHEDYPPVLRVYDAVEAWIDARSSELRCTGHPYEIYPGTVTSGDATRFDVAYPVSF